MRTIQMIFDDDLIRAVDQLAEELKTSRSAFTRNALREAIGRFNIRRLKDKHRKGYELHDVYR